MARDPFDIALEHHRGGRLRQAEAGYRAVLADDPAHADALHWLGVLTLTAGQPGAAVTLLSRACEHRPGDSAFQHNLGHALLATGRADEALAAFHRAAELEPANSATLIGIALAHLARNTSADAEQAIQNLRRAQAAGDNSVEVAHHRAVALLQLRRVDEAIAQCRAAIANKPDYASAHHHLAVALRAKGAAADAHDALQKAVESDPAFARAWHGLAVMAAEAGRPDEAEELFRRAIEARRDYVPAYHGLAHVFTQSGRADEARRVLEEAACAAREQADLRTGSAPGDSSISSALAELEAKLGSDGGKAAESHYALASLLRIFPPAQSPKAGITKLFDGYADRFDKHLEGKLGYRVPALLASAVAETKPAKLLDVLDLGCGTGLCGAALRPLARWLHGVDLSAAMIEKSRERSVYDELTCGDMLDVLRSRSDREQYDLIAAADVLIYTGDLAPVFEAAADALRPAGLLAFSVEAGGGDRYYLQATRRYAHSRPYLEHLAQIFGFSIERFDTITVRTEAGKPVPGYLVLMRTAGGEQTP
jgi:predicted TPR repeat methyltransferase